MVMRKKNEELNRLTGKRIEKAVIAKYGNSRGNQSAFRRDLEKKYGHIINRATISNLINGKTTLYADIAEDYSKVLNVPADYLLGKIEFMNPEERREQLKNEISSKWSQEDFHKIALFKRIMLLLAKEHIIFFDAYENKRISKKTSKRIEKKIVFEANSIRLYDLDKKHSSNYQNITPEGFYNWICDQTVLIKTDSEDNTFRYIHIADNISIVKKHDSNTFINLDINGFMKIIHDIEDSMNAAMQSRIDFYFRYSEYNYQDDLRQDYEDYDL